MSISNKNFRDLEQDEFIECFLKTRRETVEILKIFRSNLGSELRIPNLKEANLPIWEFCHVGWFYERWIVRNTRCSFDKSYDLSVNWDSFCNNKTHFKDADSLFDSSKIEHDARWGCKLPTFYETLDYLEKIGDAVIEKFETNSPETEEAFYFYKLSLAHEMMHLEAFKMTAQLLNFEIPGLTNKYLSFDLSSESSFLSFNKQTISPYYENYAFHFDNEFFYGETAVKPFKIQSSFVSLKSFLEFLLSDDFFNASFWSNEGQIWLTTNFYKKSFYKIIKKEFKKITDLDSEFVKVKWFGRDEILHLNLPALHVSFYEAEAYAKWIGMRLPTELEWLLASQNTNFHWGNIWEWTSSTFSEFPAFFPHPYRDYSKPWFDGHHKSVKGASFATCENFRNLHFRNFYKPDRTDIFSGFRTACFV